MEKVALGNTNRVNFKIVKKGAIETQQSDSQVTTHKKFTVLTFSTIIKFLIFWFTEANAILFVIFTEKTTKNKMFSMCSMPSNSYFYVKQNISMLSFLLYL